MVMKSGERWHCMNPACLCAVLVETSGELEGSNPRCSCGSIMKKDYSPPCFPLPRNSYASRSRPLRPGLVVRTEPCPQSLASPRGRTFF